MKSLKIEFKDIIINNVLFLTVEIALILFWIFVIGKLAEGSGLFDGIGQFLLTQFIVIGIYFTFLSYRASTLSGNKFAYLTFSYIVLFFIIIITVIRDKLLIGLLWLGLLPLLNYATLPLFRILRNYFQKIIDYFKK